MNWKRSRNGFMGLLSIAVLTASRVQAADNLLVNGGFEVETPESAWHALYWKMNAPAAHGDCWGSARRETWRSRSGFYVMAIRGEWAGAGSSGGVWQERPCRPGVRYSAALWSWADNSWKPGKQQLKLEFWNREGTTKIAEEVLNLENPGENWKEQKLSAEAPAGSAWVRLVVSVEQAGAQDALQLDDLSLEEAKTN